MRSFVAKALTAACVAPLFLLASCATEGGQDHPAEELDSTQAALICTLPNGTDLPPNSWGLNSSLTWVSTSGYTGSSTSTNTYSTGTRNGDTCNAYVTSINNITPSQINYIGTSLGPSGGSGGSSCPRTAPFEVYDYVATATTPWQLAGSGTSVCYNAGTIPGCVCLTATVSGSALRSNATKVLVFASGTDSSGNQVPVTNLYKNN